MSAPAPTSARARDVCAPVGHVASSSPQWRKTTTVSLVRRASRTARRSRGSSFADASPSFRGPAVHSVTRWSSRTCVAPMIAIRCPLTSTLWGAYACVSFHPAPTIGTPARFPAASVSRRPVGPKSMPWLLATFTTSTPPAARAENALAGARKVNAFAAGAPRSVTAVSRLTIATSARRRIGAIGASTLAGEAAFRSRMGLSKWTSPPKASVTAFPLPRRSRAGAAVEVGFRFAGGTVRTGMAGVAEPAEAALADWSPPIASRTARAPSTTSVATPDSATARRRRT